MSGSSFVDGLLELKRETLTYYCNMGSLECMMMVDGIENEKTFQNWYVLYFCLFLFSLFRIYLQKQFGLRSSKNEKTKWQNVGGGCA